MQAQTQVNHAPTVPTLQMTSTTGIITEGKEGAQHGFNKKVCLQALRTKQWLLLPHLLRTVKSRKPTAVCAPKVTTVRRQEAENMNTSTMAA